jgi:prepilin-type N-terminal cleavage/methylation domain-containing protein
MRAARTRSGFTLVELLIVVVLGSFLVMVIYQVMITNSRTYTVNNAQIQGQQMLRAGMDVLFGELREVSSQSGDLMDTEDDALTIRAQRAFGLVCAVDYTVSPPQLTLFRVGPAFEAGDSVFVFHDNDPERALDDEWFGGVVTAVDTTTSCGTSPGQTLTLPFVGTTAAATPPDSVRVGAPVRAFDVYTYGQYEIDGEPYLGRQLRGAPSPDPLVGPLLGSGGVAFRYLDTVGAVTTVDSLVAQIEVTLRYRSEVLGFGGEVVSDSILVRVYPRN